MLVIQDRFAPESLARRMRKQFESRFENPLKADSRRFVWDYWNVPGQYNLLRTVPGEIFGAKEWKALTGRILDWGRENLGCHGISEPWLSCYVEGNEQRFHGDRPHGPFAFVWSLTEWKERVFSGGETLLLRPEILDYWRQSGERYRGGMNVDEVLERVPPLWNRLTVFDPRIPHAVAQVRGARDVCEGRLVVHGWFVQPRPFVMGSLSGQEVQHLIDGCIQELGEVRAEVQGHLIWRIHVSAAGTVGKVTCLVDTLQGDSAAAEQIKRSLTRKIRMTEFRRHSVPSFVTLPIAFDF